MSNDQIKNRLNFQSNCTTRGRWITVGWIERVKTGVTKIDGMNRAYTQLFVDRQPEIRADSAHTEEKKTQIKKGNKLILFIWGMCIQ